MKNFTAIFLASLLAGVLCAQPKASLSADDYARAERFLTPNTQKYVDNVPGAITWLPGDRFWYRTLTAVGSEFILVDAVKATRLPAFDHQKLAETLSAATGRRYTATMLPFQTFTFSGDEKSISFDAADKNWKYELKTSQMTQKVLSAEKPAPQASNEALSPDKKKAVFIKNHNLWVRDLTTNQVTQLTLDGVRNFGYATDNAGWKHSAKANVVWSPDSKKVATYQQDERNVGDMYLVTTNVGHPKLESWKYPLPGDSVIAMLHRVIIDVETAKVIRLQIGPDAHRGTLGDDITRAGVLSDIAWSNDASQLAFVSTSRDHKQEKVRIADATTGAVKEVFEEISSTQFESGQSGISWRFLAGSKEIIWYSERDNWGHLYLYDVTTGKLKNQITRGEWVVTQVVKVDEKTSTIYFMANEIGRAHV